MTDAQALKTIIADIPKAELHLHLEGSISPETVSLLGARRGVTIAPEAAAARYAYTDFAGFLDAFKWATGYLKKPEDYAAAARWYRAYLSSFPGDPDLAATNYLLADALFESHQYGEAVTEYEHTAYDYPPGNRSAVAGYAALVSYQKQEELLPAAQKAAWHAKAVDAGLKFAERFPNHPETPGVLTRAAQDVFASADLPRAIGVANLLLAHQPPVDQAKQRIAWTIIGQAQFSLGVFDQSELGFTRALALTPANDPQHSDLTERLAAAVYNQADSKRKSGDDAGGRGGGNARRDGGLYRRRPRG